MKHSITLFIMLAGTACLLSYCQSPQPGQTSVDFRPEAVPYKTLSEYGFFTGQMKALQPNAGVLSYELITPLFSDYAYKARFAWMPDSLQASVDTEGAVIFPDHTVLIKNFYYPADFRQPEEAWDIVETRLLVKNAGKWKAFTYVWNEQQTEATLKVTGDFRPVSWVDLQGQKQAIAYVVPNQNQCKSCHNIDKQFQPIGAKVRNLAIGDQLLNWQAGGMLAAGDYASRFPAVADYEDPQSGTVEERALAYLDVNCGHCHNPSGPAHTSGLYLTVDHKGQKGQLGFCKTPVAAGKGSGNRKFGIVPGQPDSSILVYRMESNDPGIMMPELGRVIKHNEGIALVKEWIAGLEGSCE